MPGEKAQGWWAGVLERRQASREQREGLELKGDPLGVVIRWAVYAAVVLAVVAYFTEPAARQEVDGFVSGAWQMLTEAWGHSKG